MSEWNLYGRNRKREFMSKLEPENLARDFDDFRSRYEATRTGTTDFTLDRYLKILEIEAWAMVAEAINDAPEFLVDQVSKYENEVGRPINGHF